VIHCYTLLYMIWQCCEKSDRDRHAAFTLSAILRAHCHIMWLVHNWREWRRPKVNFGHFSSFFQIDVKLLIYMYMVFFKFHLYNFMVMYTIIVLHSFLFPAYPKEQRRVHAEALSFCYKQIETYQHLMQAHKTIL